MIFSKYDKYSVAHGVIRVVLFLLFISSQVVLYLLFEKLLTLLVGESMFLVSGLMASYAVLAAGLICLFFRLANYLYHFIEDKADLD